MYWTLDGHNVVRCTRDEWARMMDMVDVRTVAKNEVGEVVVSTVFLGIDHSFGAGVPLLFETMVFGGELNEVQERYTTWEQAETGHAVMLARVLEATHA